MNARMTVNCVGVVHDSNKNIVAFWDRPNGIIEMSKCFVKEELKNSLWATAGCYIYNVHDDVTLFDKINEVVNF